jgi:hypothetical protein
VFLLLLCNDRQVLGPWVNGRALNVFTSAVIAVLVMLSIVLTAAVIFPSITSTAILTILVIGVALAVLAGIALLIGRRVRPAPAGIGPPPLDRRLRATWRMPPLALLTRPTLSTGRRLGLTVLRGYLVIAAGMVIVRVVQLALAGH